MLLSNGERTAGKLKEYTDEKLTLLAGDDGAEETVLQTEDIAGAVCGTHYGLPHG